MSEFDWVEEQLEYKPPMTHWNQEVIDEALWIMGYTMEDIRNGTLRVGVRRILVQYNRFKLAWENQNGRPFSINEITVDGRIYNER